MVYTLREDHFPKAETSLSGMLSPKKKTQSRQFVLGPDPHVSFLQPPPYISSCHSFFYITRALHQTLVAPSVVSVPFRSWLIALLHLICSLMLTTIKTDLPHWLPRSLSLSLQKQTRPMTVRSYLFYSLWYPRVNRISRCPINESTWMKINLLLLWMSVF